MRQIAKSYDTKKYTLSILSTDSEKVTLDGYYQRSVEVTEEIYLLVGLLTDRINELEAVIATDGEA